MFSHFPSICLLVLTTLLANSSNANRDIILKKHYLPGDPLPAKTVYLTFDDGPSEFTDLILDVLDKYQVKATFFVCAFPEKFKKEKSYFKSNFHQHKKTLNRIIDSGHSLGNHTANHVILGGLSEKIVDKEIMLNQILLNNALGSENYKFTSIRPPYGDPWRLKYRKHLIKNTFNYLKKHGSIVLWSKAYDSTDSAEWVPGERPASFEVKDKILFNKKVLRIQRKLIENLNGTSAIILFHDTHLTTVHALPKIIEHIKKMKYNIRNLDEYVNSTINY